MFNTYIIFINPDVANKA